MNWYPLRDEDEETEKDGGIDPRKYEQLEESTCWAHLKHQDKIKKLFDSPELYSQKLNTRLKVVVRKLTMQWCSQLESRYK